VQDSFSHATALGHGGALTRPGGFENQILPNEAGPFARGPPPTPAAAGGRQTSAAVAKPGPACFNARVSAAREFRNIALIGFMGTGKSSVGRLLAHLLHFQFVDTDELIEARAGKRITEIFAQDGEPAFRELERQVVAELSSLKETVIATGGGLGANADNLASLKAHALVACLWATPETIYERVRHHTHRPLLQGPDPKGRIKELLAQREPFYRQADVLVNTGLRPMKEVAQQILHEFRRARLGGGRP
jgi:shikimate kinase